jgi:hypothetical protein
LVLFGQLWEKKPKKGIGWMIQRIEWRRADTNR